MTHPRQRRARLAAASVCALAMLAGCGGGDNSATPATTTTTTSSGTNTTRNGPVSSAPRQSNGLEFTLTADKSVYAPGETVQLTLTIKNVGTQRIEFSVAPAFPGWDAAVSQGQQTVWQLSTALQNATTGANATSTALAPGQTGTYGVNWYQDYSSGGQAPSGTYTTTMWLRYLVRNGVEQSIANPQTDLAANPVQITIQP